MISDSDYQNELETALEAAERSCKVMEEMKNSVEISSRKKSYNDILTEVDEKCQEVIEETLMGAFPDDGFKAEELEEERKQNRMWVVDPIDGTSNYVKNFEYYCTSIALKIGEDVKVAVIMSPESALNRLWFAVENEGAYMSNKGKMEDAKEIRVSEHQEMKGALIESKRKSEVEGQKLFDSKINARLVEKDAMIRIMDAGALSCARTAEGVFDGFISGIENEWDYIAGKLILKEAGGSIRDEESHLNGRTMVIASNGSIQDELEDVADHHLQDI